MQSHYKSSEGLTAEDVAAAAAALGHPEVDCSRTSKALAKLRAEGLVVSIGGHRKLRYIYTGSGVTARQMGSLAAANK
jgi:hypothetical protein